MINKIAASIFLFFLLLSSLHGVIFEIEDLFRFEKEASKLNDSALVLIDIDYTLLTPKDNSLKPCGKGLRRKYLHILAPERREYLQSIIALESEEELMDAKFPPLIERMRNANISVIGFTALETGKYGKIANLEDWRLNQLKKFCIDFTPTFQGKKTIILNESSPRNGNYPLFKNGVLFSNRLPKGEAFPVFLKKTGSKPSKILLIDDSIEQLKSLESAANVLGIEFIGFHYTAAETNPCKIDLKVGEFQFRNLVENQQWLSDPEARKFLEKQLAMP